MSSGRALQARVAAPLRGARLVRSALRLLATQPAVTAVSLVSGAQLVAGIVLVEPLMFGWVSSWLPAEVSGVISMVLTMVVVGIPCSVVDAYLDVVQLVMLRDAEHGRRATVSGGLRAANRRLRAIGAWSVVSSGGFAGRTLLSLVPGTRLLRWGGGLVFELGTFFVTPVIAYEDRGAAGTFRRSAELIRRSARQTLAPSAGMVVACLPAFLPGLALIWAAHLVPAQAWVPGDPHPPADQTLLVLGLAGLVPGALLVGTSSLLLRFALYERATGGSVPQAYSERDLEAALPA